MSRTRERPARLADRVEALNSRLTVPALLAGSDRPCPSSIATTGFRRYTFRLIGIDTPETTNSSRFGTHLRFMTATGARVHEVAIRTSAFRGSILLGHSGRPSLASGLRCTGMPAEAGRAGPSRSRAAH